MLPIPLNIGKITFLQAVRYIAVLIPGIVIVGAIAMASPEDFHAFMRVPELGYYAKLSFLVAAAYLIGFVLDEVVTMVVGFIFGVLGSWLLKSEKRRTIIDTLLLSVAPWQNVNWQKLAATYLGPNLTPDAEAEPQWRFWYLVIKAGVPKLEERFIRTSVHGGCRTDLFLGASNSADCCARPSLPCCSSCLYVYLLSRKRG